MFKSFSFYLALLGIILAAILSNILNQPEPELKSIIPPSQSPFKKYIQASGIIQSIDKNVIIGSPEDGLVDHVYVRVGDKVKQGDPLFKLDTRRLEAELEVQKASEEVEKAQYEKEKEHYELFEGVNDPKAISGDELQFIKNSMLVAQAKWKMAKAKIQETLELIDRLTVRSPKDGTLLELEVRPGEYLSHTEKVIVLGNLTNFQILVSIDEQNAVYFNKTSPAVAFPKNNTSLEIPLSFYRVDPYVIPKKSLTGLSEEKIDTRVLQVLYTFDSIQEYPLYVGQQMDVFIERK